MLSFRPLVTTDFPLLLEWLQRPHVKEWWNDGEDTLEKVAASYGLPAADEGRFILMARRASINLSARSTC